jgi:ABC-type transport system involved in multi-copper enzyme maturation permease subunit
MKDLLRVEIRRLTARRLSRILTLLVVVGFLAAGTIAFFVSNDSPDAIAAARAKHGIEVQKCVAGAGQDGVPTVGTAAWCERHNDVGDPRFHFKDMDWPLMSLGLPLMMLGWLVGASYVGAEWHHRTMMAHLTWEPRRGRVLVSKAIAVFLTTAAWVLALEIVFSALMWPAALFRGSTAGLDAGWWSEYGLTVLRLAGLAGFAALFGASLAFVGRNAAAALGVGFAYLAIVEGLVRSFKPSWADWLIGDNVGQFGTWDRVLGHSPSASGLLLTGYVAVAVGLAWLFFRKREVS